MNLVGSIKLFILVTIISFASDQDTRCFSQDYDINSLITRLRENVRVLESVAYDAHVMVRRIGTDGNETKLKYRLEFRSDGIRYYSRLQLESDNGEDMDRTVAFDGATFESLDEEVGVLQFSSIPTENLPYLFPQPFIYLYGFVFGGNKRLDLPMLSDAEPWRDFQSRISSVESLAPENGSSETIKLNYRLPEGEGNVLLSKAKNWLPVQVRTRTSNMSSTLRVEKAKKYLHKQTALYFPLEIVDRAFDGNGVLRYELVASLDPVSVKLNENFESSSFKIDRARARWLDDVDSRLAGKAKIIEINPKSFSRARTYLFAAAFLAICLGAWVFAYRSKSQRSAG